MHVRKLWFAFAFVFLSLLSLSPLAHAAAPRWETDGALLVKVMSHARSGGLTALKPHAKALESALKGARTLFAKPVSEGGTTFVLTDGKTETAAALIAAKGSGEVVAVDNPYPAIGFMLGSFYVETGKFRGAVRVLDAALALSPLPKQRLGEAVPQLLGERGIALLKLKRLDEALASYDAALRAKQSDSGIHALLHRGRGFVLIEMGRLEEAEAAYRKSLRFDPGNKIALHEIAYIAGLRAGGKRVEPALVKSQRN